MLKPLTDLIGNSTLHKVAGLVAAGLAAVLGPGITSETHVAFAGIAALYSAVIHWIDTVEQKKS